MSDQLQTMLDQHAMRQSLTALARGEDRRDAGLIAAAWWPDATFDYGVYAGTFDQYLAWVVPGADAITNTQHVLGQSHFERHGDAWRVETHVISYHRVLIDGAERDTCIGGRYCDVFEQRAGEWRLARRTMLYDWSQDWGEAADWSQGVMGYPFAADHFPGRARGDWSEAFLRGDAQ